MSEKNAFEFFIPLFIEGILHAETTGLGKNGLYSQTILGRWTYKVINTSLEIYRKY